MKPRHAAALALVGWYLMFPFDYLRAGPIAGWSVRGSAYATAGHCRTARKKALEAAEKCEEGQNQYCGSVQIPTDNLKISKCIRSGDPILYGYDPSQAIGKKRWGELLYPWVPAN